MVGAVMATNDLSMKAGSFWLLASYGVITIGELCLSPMGLSLVSKLSPPNHGSDDGRVLFGGFGWQQNVRDALKPLGELR